MPPHSYTILPHGIEAVKRKNEKKCLWSKSGLFPSAPQLSCKLPESRESRLELQVAKIYAVFDKSEFMRFSPDHCRRPSDSLSYVLYILVGRIQFPKQLQLFGSP